MGFLKSLLNRTKSLSFSVGIIVFLFIMVPVSIMVSVYYNSIKTREINSLSGMVTSQAQLISSQIISGGYMDPDSRIQLDTRLGALRETFAGRIMIMDKSMKILIDTYNVYEGKTLIWENALRSSAGETISEYDDTNHLITVSIPIATGSDIADGNVQGVVMITRTADYIEQNMEFFQRIAFIIMIVALFLSIIGVFLSVRFILMAFLRINNGVKELSDGTRLRIENTGLSEVNMVSSSINDFSEKLRDYDGKMKEFVSNVSHELKTPLTSMKLLADSIMMSEDVPVEFYREFMEDITKEVDRETDIINDLITIVRTEENSDNFETEIININELMEDVLKRLRPIAERARVELLLETFKPVMAMIDKVKFSQAMMNLVENAIKYNREEGGFVHVSVNSDASFVFIRVEDNGIGIPQEDKDLIFDRFFRVDKSHSKEIEGTGLGLAIVKNIIKLHNGQIRVESIEGMGTTFIVRIPLSRT